VIIYAGAIMVLFIFVIMLLNLGQEAVRQESQWLNPRMWIGPAILATILMAELVYMVTRTGPQPYGVVSIDPQQVGLALFGPYLLGVELAAMLLLAGMVGAYHLGRGIYK
jgi:NADH-quinone oxidoreductase subunit J